MSQINYSIIIPHRNTPDLLRKCLNSIPVRSDVQVIVVDDNSDSEKVDFGNFPQWPGENYEFYMTKEGLGAGFARNVGMEHVRGKWILFADADDFFHPCLSDLMDKYVDSDADILFCKANSVNLSDGSLAHRADGYNSRVDVALTAGDYQPALLYSCPWGKIFCAELVKNIRFNESPCGNDVVFMAKTASAGIKFQADSSVMYCITVSGSSITSNRSLRNMEIRLQQDLEGIEYYKRTMILTEEDKYWYFMTWWNVYERSIWTAFRYKIPMFRAIGIRSFMLNYMRLTKRSFKKRFK